MWFRFKNDDRWRALAKPGAIAGALIFSLTVGSAPGPAVAALPPLVFGQFEALAILAPSPLVRRIQELLTELEEYDGPADGRMNDDTLAAVKAYQRRSGLDDDGRVTQALIDYIEFTGKAIALTLAAVGSVDRALEATNLIQDPRVMAEALWAVVLAQTPGNAGENTIGRFNTLVASFPSALDRTWVLCNAAIRARSQGNSSMSQTLLARALAEAESIQDPWARAQALAKAATTLVTLAGAP